MAWKKGRQTKGGINSHMKRFYMKNPQGPVRHHLREYQDRIDSIARGEVAPKTKGLSLPRQEILANHGVETIEVKWESVNGRGWGINSFNFVVINKSVGAVTKLFFSGQMFILVEERSKFIKRSLIYRSRERALEVFGANQVTWVEGFNPQDTSQT